MKIIDNGDLTSFAELYDVKKKSRLWMFYWSIFENDSGESQELADKIKNKYKNIDKELDKALIDLHNSVKKANEIYIKLKKISPKY